MNLWFLVPLGIIVVLLGFFFILLGSIQHLEYEKREREKSGTFQENTKIKGGGVIMIGPIPIIFGSDYKFAIIAILLAIILILIVFIFAQ